LSEGKFNKQQMHYMFSAGPLAMATWSRGMEMGLERTRLSEEPSAKREPRPCQTHWGTSTPFTYAACSFPPRSIQTFISWTLFVLGERVLHIWKRLKERYVLMM